MVCDRGPDKRFVKSRSGIQENKEMLIALWMIKKVTVKFITDSLQGTVIDMEISGNNKMIYMYSIL